MSYDVDVWYDRPTNRNVRFILDQARRLADYIDIRAKRGQTDERVARNRMLSLRFRTRKAAIDYQELVEEYCEEGVLTKRW